MTSETSKASESPALHLAYTPCPNDTFIFHALATGQIGLEGTTLEVHLDDVETLNQAARKGVYDITKLSFYAYLLVQDEYDLLRTGAALGFGCGPLLVSSRPLSRDTLASCRVAVPGELTTAHLLLRLYAPEAANRLFTTYDNIIDWVKTGEADCGVIIHEDRFTYEKLGLHKIADLGSWWEQETGAPIPLGCIAIRKSLAGQYAEDFDTLVRLSIALASRDFSRALPYIREHAQQMDNAVIQKHIATFVNEHTIDLGEAGDRAVSVLKRMAAEAGVIS